MSDILVGLLTIEQKDLLINQLFDEDSYFNPLQDFNGNWIISIEEIEQNIYYDYNWLQDLEMILFVPVVNPMPF